LTSLMQEKTLGDEVLEDQVRGRGRPKAADKSMRIHIVMPEALAKRVVEIQKETHATSITEVVKNALVLYAAALEEHKQGGVLVFRRPKGVERQLALFV
jgi:hypothetical protein